MNCKKSPDYKMLIHFSKSFLFQSLLSYTAKEPHIELSVHVSFKQLK